MRAAGRRRCSRCTDASPAASRPAFRGSRRTSASASAISGSRCSCRASAPSSPSGSPAVSQTRFALRSFVMARSLRRARASSCRRLPTSLAALCAVLLVFVRGRGARRHGDECGGRPGGEAVPPVGDVEPARLLERGRPGRLGRLGPRVPRRYRHTGPVRGRGSRSRRGRRHSRAAADRRPDGNRRGRAAALRAPDPARPPDRAVGRCAVFGEQAGTDWSAFYIRNELGGSASVAALAVSAFAVAMATVSSMGDPRGPAGWGRSVPSASHGRAPTSAPWRSCGAPTLRSASSASHCSGFGLDVARPLAFARRACGRPSCAQHCRRRRRRLRERSRRTEGDRRHRLGVVAHDVVLRRRRTGWSHCVGCGRASPEATSRRDELRHAVDDGGVSGEAFATAADANELTHLRQAPTTGLW